MEQELEAARRRLGHSEDSREALVQQVCLCLCVVLVDVSRHNNNLCSIFSETVCLPHRDSHMSFSGRRPQVEDMRGELLRMRKEKTEFPHGNHTFRDGGQRGAGTESKLGLWQKGENIWMHPLKRGSL